MISIKVAPPNIIIATLSGTITHADYRDEFIPTIEEVAAGGKGLSVCVDFAEDFAGYEPLAMFDDAKVGIKYWKSFNKAAMVNLPDQYKPIIRFFSFLMPCPVREFNDLESVKIWVSVKTDD